MISFVTRLHAAVRGKCTPALVGLDPRLDWLPADVLERARSEHEDPEAIAAAAFEEFCVRIIDVVSPLVPAVKPQAAFFEEYGPDGCLALARVMRYARSRGLIVICDAKRGDIGTTAEAYARAYLAGDDPQAAPWSADALTVNPYLGSDTLQPFVKVARERGAGIYVLVRTSNPGAKTFQDLSRCREPSGTATHDQQSNANPSSTALYQVVADVVEELTAGDVDADGYGCVGAVVGATYPAELAELRQRMPHAPLLVPGYGSQGGTAADVAAAFDDRGLGGLVNNSRGINFAFRSGPFAGQFAPQQWETAVEAATKQMVAELAAHTPAGRLES